MDASVRGEAWAVGVASGCDDMGRVKVWRGLITWKYAKLLWLLARRRVAYGASTNRGREACVELVQLHLLRCGGGGLVEVAGDCTPLALPVVAVRVVGLSPAAHVGRGRVVCNVTACG